MAADKKQKRELIYVIAGKDESLVNFECDKLLDGLLGEQERTTGFFNADPTEVSVSDVLDELRTLPFLAEMRVVLIRRAEKFISANRELLEKYFDNPSSTGTLVMTVGTWDARTKLAKKLTSAGSLINVVVPRGGQLSQRLVQYAGDAHSKRLNRDAAELLVELGGDEMGRLYSEIDKLALYADSQKSITAGHVEALVGHNRFFNAFAVIDAVIAGNCVGAVERLRKMFSEDKSAEYTVVGAFAFHLRRMFNARVLMDKRVHTSQIAKQLRIWGNVDGFFAQVRRLSLERIGEILGRLADIDYAIKTGRTTARVAIEQLVLNLATRRG